MSRLALSNPQTSESAGMAAGGSTPSPAASGNLTSVTASPTCGLGMEFPYRRKADDSCRPQSERESRLFIPSASRRIDEPAATLIACLKGLRGGDHAVADLVALGPSAVPSLRSFLFQPEPSGIYEPRCHAVAALGALKAEDVLLDFISAARTVRIEDPVERTGEDAVINAAARAIRHRRDDATFDILMRMARQRPMSGVIDALGDMGRDQAIPCLVAGLSSDFARRSAEAALRKFGSRARPHLIAAALDAQPAPDNESETSLRARCGALDLLGEIGLTLDEWSQLKPLMAANDNRVAALAAHLALITDQPAADREAALKRLIELLRCANWLLVVHIEEWLASNCEDTIRFVNRAVDRDDPLVADTTVRASLLRVVLGHKGERLSARWDIELA